MVMVLTHVRLPPEELSEIRAFAAANSRSVQDEMRRRLIRGSDASYTFEAQSKVLESQSDPLTDALAGLMREVAQRAERTLPMDGERGLKEFLSTVGKAIDFVLSNYTGKDIPKISDPIQNSVLITWDIVLGINAKNERPGLNPAAVALRRAFAEYANKSGRAQDHE